MSAYTLGVLLGRLVASIILTYILIWIFSGFKAKRANQRIKKPLAWILVATIFLLGVAGGAAAEQLPERDLRPFVVTDFPDAKLTLYVPERPKWTSEQSPRRGTAAIILSTPAHYYPPTSIELVHNHGLKIPESERQEVALSALRTIRKASGLESELHSEELRSVQLGGIQGYEDRFVMEQSRKRYSVRSMMGVFESGSPITVFAVTGEGQLSHIEHMLVKILRNTQAMTD